MATKVYTEETFELQDGTEVTVRPLNIKGYRKFMESFKRMEESADDEDKVLEVILDSVAIALERDDKGKELAEDREAMEEALDVPTIWKILEIAAGIEVDNPNLQRAGFAGRT